MPTTVTGTSSAAILGLTLRLMRKRYNVIREEMASMMQDSVSTWGRYERGEADIPASKLRLAAELFETTDLHILKVARLAEDAARERGLKVVVGYGSTERIKDLLTERGKIPECTVLTERRLRELLHNKIAFALLKD